MASYVPDESKINEALWGDTEGFDAAMKSGQLKLQEFLNGAKLENC